MSKLQSAHHSHTGLAYLQIEVRSLCSLPSVLAVYNVEVRSLCSLLSTFCGNIAQCLQQQYIVLKSGRFAPFLLWQQYTVLKSGRFAPFHQLSVVMWHIVCSSSIYTIEVRSLCSLPSVVAVCSVEVRLLCSLPTTPCGQYDTVLKSGSSALFHQLSVVMQHIVCSSSIQYCQVTLLLFFYDSSIQC